MTNVISLDSHRPEPGEMAVSILLDSEGVVETIWSDEHLRTREQVDWALAHIAMAMAELVEYKKELPL